MRSGIESPRNATMRHRLSTPVDSLVNRWGGFDRRGADEGKPGNQCGRGRAADTKEDDEERCDVHRRGCEARRGGAGQRLIERSGDDALDGDLDRGRANQRAQTDERHAHDGRAAPGSHFSAPWLVPACATDGAPTAEYRPEPGFLDALGWEGGQNPLSGWSSARSFARARRGSLLPGENSPL